MILFLCKSLQNYKLVSSRVDALIPTDASLWHRLIDGDESAFSKLFEQYYPALLRYGKSFMPDSDRVQDCVQDVFADVWVYRSSILGSWEILE